MLVSVVKLALRRRNRRGVHSMTLPDPSKTAADRAKRNAQQTQKQYHFSWSSDSFDRLDRRCARECPATPTTTYRSRFERWGGRGLAHIGVLRFLEEHRIPIDNIAGTSMGGLLAGLYATGRSSADLEKIARNAKWSDLLRFAPSYVDRPVAEKQEWNRIFRPMDFSVW